jgi:hypothetical protein
MAEACIFKAIRTAGSRGDRLSGWRPADLDHGDLAGEEASRSMAAGGCRIVS